MPKPPTFHTIAMKTTKATATQNSAVSNMLVAPVSVRGHGAVERPVEAGLVRGLPRQALDDGGRRLGRDATDIAHRVLGAGPDGRLGGRELLVQLGLERLALGLGLGGERVAGLLRDVAGL